jgi:hypothetical protein
VSTANRAERRRQQRQNAIDAQRLRAWRNSHNYTSNNHTQVTIRDEERDWEAEVDERLAPLILRLWAHDIVTISSCEDAAAFLSQSNVEGFSLVGKFALCFLRPSDLANFLRRVSLETPQLRVRAPVVANERGWLLFHLDTTAEGKPGIIANAFIPWDDFGWVLDALT